MTEIAETPVQRLDHVVIRFAGDSGDGMQLAGDRFTSETAEFGNDLSTLPDFPAEIRAPAGTLPGVSAFQLHFGDHSVLTPGDHADVLVAMNPAALKANLGQLRRAGTIIVNTNDRFLYLLLGNNVALRYGICVGRDGFQWGGIHKISRKAEWPDWTPPPEMIQRQPYLPRWMAGGPGNPLGARALYIGTTVYRIHGTNAPETIGQAVSSGCFRLVNDDIVDLYQRVPVGTKVVVQHQ